MPEEGLLEDGRRGGKRWGKVMESGVGQFEGWGVNGVVELV